MAERNGYWGFEGTLYEWPMTVEIDEEKFEILSITVPVEEEDGKTASLRFVPDDENEKLRKLCSDLRYCAKQSGCPDCPLRFCNMRFDERCRELGIEVVC